MIKALWIILQKKKKEKKKCKICENLKKEIKKKAGKAAYNFIIIFIID